MRTTITVDDDIAADLMSLTGKDSLPQAVREAVKWYIERRQKEKLLSLFGNLDLEIDPAEVRSLWERDVKEDIS